MVTIASVASGRAVLAAALVSVLLAGAGFAAPAAAGTGAACRVRNLDTGITRKSLQGAVNWAVHGNRLTLRGTCRGTTTIAKTLWITGIRTRTSGPPILDGDHKGNVVVVKANVAVTMKQLTIRNGRVTQDGGPWAGGGIYNEGWLRLRDVTVRRNSGPSLGIGVPTLGGAIYNGHRLTLNGKTTIKDNRTDFNGGGVYNVGTLTMNDHSLIAANRAGSDGGGVLLYFGATLRMHGSSRIEGNVAGGSGGGLWFYSDASTVLDGVVCGPGKGTNVRKNFPNDCDWEFWP